MQQQVFYAVVLVLGSLGQAWAREPAPDFTAKALGGETFTKDSVRGSVVLVQFWTTWCPVCREDQSAVESLSSEFAAQRLVVLAVNVRESEATVRRYLAERPRSCPVVLTRDTDLVAKFNPHSFPQYMVFDRAGNVAGTQNGGAGEESLRYLLRRAGLKRASGTEMTEAGTDSSAPGQRVAAGKMIVLSGVRPNLSVATGATQAATVFVMASGERMETHQYMLTSDGVRMTVNGFERSVAISELDLKATVSANHERGISLKIPTSRHEIFLGR
jgi:thiol-disulfide isomerase/thioredoxin